MIEFVLDLITSYEARISTVEKLIANTYQATVACQRSLSNADEERERLVSNLQEMLARNCSLRKRDFSSLIQRNLSSSDERRSEIEDERNRVRETVNQYLHEQTALANLLREQLLQATHDNTDDGTLQVVLSRIKSSCQDGGQGVFAMLRDYELQLVAYQNEQEEANRRLRMLVDRGESLKIEDLRQLEAVRSRHERITEKDLRRDQVERLLAHFKEQRQDNRHCRQ